MDFLRNKKIYVESYGCTFNHADTQKLIEVAESQGCVQVPPEEAEVFIINTCTVIASTGRHMLKRMKEFSDREVVVTGCMPVVQMDEIRKVCEPHLIRSEEIMASTGRVGAMTAPGVGVVQIGTGCLGACAYCITRFARGRLSSFPEEEILRETERLVAAGAHEIQLTGQDVSSYGRDCGRNLAGLLQKMADLPGDFMVRVGMMNPATVLPIRDDLIKAFAREKIFSFLHVPVQSGSDSVLLAMNRGYSGGDFIDLVSAFREKIPDIRISTDLIVGYPVETDEDFEDTLDLLRTTKPNKVNITRFSVRPGTPAGQYYDMPDWIKKNRSRALTKAAHATFDEVNDTYIGRHLSVIVTEKKKEGSVIARDHSYMDVVIMGDLPIGAHAEVRITSHRCHYLIGELI